jgi:hypothetical protein
MWKTELCAILNTDIIGDESGLRGGGSVAGQGKAEEQLGFEFETEKLGRVYCRPLNFKRLFRLTDLTKRAPDTVPDFLCALLSVVGQRRDIAPSADGAISGEQARTLTEQELEQFAAKFLKAANWVGLGGRTKPTGESAEECSHSEQLKRAFEAYEKGLAEEARSYPLLDGFSEVVFGDSDLKRRSITGLTGAAKPGFWYSVNKSISGVLNGGLEQGQRVRRVASVDCKRLLGNARKKWQQQKSGIARHVGLSLTTLRALRQQLVNSAIPSHILHKIDDQLEKIRGRLKPLRAKGDESVNRVVYRRVLLGVVIFAAVIGLCSPVFLYLIARADSRSQELVAIGNLTRAVSSLSERMDIQTRELAELVKKHDAEMRNAAQQPGPLHTCRQEARDKRPYHHASIREQQRKVRNTPPTRALKLSHK